MSLQTPTTDDQRREPFERDGFFVVLDDRLVVARGGVWLDEPIRERPIDMKEIISNDAKD